MVERRRLSGCERALRRVSARVEARRFRPDGSGVAVVAPVASGSSTDPVETTSLRKRAPSSVAAGHVVTDKAPRTTGAYPSVIILEPQEPRSSPVPTEPQLMDQ